MGLLRKIIKQVEDLGIGNDSFNDAALHSLYTNLKLYYEADEAKAKSVVETEVKNANGGQEFLVLQHCIKTTIKGNDLTNDVTASIRKIIANNESEALGYFIKITKEDFPTHSKLTPLAFKIGDIPLFDSRSSR